MESMFQKLIIRWTNLRTERLNTDADRYILINGFGVRKLAPYRTLNMCGLSECAVKKKMIDEAATFEKYGYYSTDWKPQSHKKIVAVCDGCGVIRYPNKQDYCDLCLSCSRKDVPLSAAHREAIGNGITGRIISDKTRAKMSISQNKAYAADPTIVERMSASIQGIPYEDWTEFATENLYCEKFDQACRERIRAKYEHRCFICDMHQDDNITITGKCIKLAVHHVDSNKDQGCNGVKWKLVPLCMHCHGGAHKDPIKSRLEYLLNDE